MLNFQVKNDAELGMLHQLIAKHDNLFISRGSYGEFTISRYGYLDIHKNRGSYVITLIPRTWSDGEELSFHKAIIELDKTCRQLEISKREDELLATKILNS